MMIKYNIDMPSEAVEKNLHRLINQIYKLLPNREEGIDWEKPLSTIIEELIGMNELFIGQQDLFLSLLCKLEGLFKLTELQLSKNDEFELYRRTIFECLNLINRIKSKCQV